MKYLILPLLVLCISNAQAGCAELLNGKISSIENSLGKMKLLPYLAVGAGAGAIGGGVHTLGNRTDSYQAGYYQGYASGATGTSTSSGYAAGYYAGSTGSNSTPRENGLGQTAKNVGIGAGIGAAAGTGVFFLKKLTLKKDLKHYKALAEAYSMMLYSDWENLKDNESLSLVADKVLPRKHRDNLNTLRNVLEKFEQVKCDGLLPDISMKQIKKFAKKS